MHINIVYALNPICEYSGMSGEYITGHDVSQNNEVKT
jgi:hypothetical protein